jgi:hypothetical protein
MMGRDIKPINLCDDSDGSEDADPPAPDERALRVNRRRIAQGAYGSSDSEIHDYLEGRLFPVDVHFMDPLIVTMHASRLRAPRPLHQGQLLLVCKPPRRSHWQALCFDFDNNIFGSVGAGRLNPSIASYLDAQQIRIGQFQDITPAVGPQFESECGARAAIYANWFATVRIRGSVNRRDINVPQFHADVADLMAAWRAAR